MNKRVVVAGAVAFVLGGLILPTLAQQGGRTITRETLSESSDFVRAGEYVLNRNHIAFVVRRGDQTTVYFTGNVPPVLLSSNGDALIEELAPSQNKAWRPVAPPPGLETGELAPIESTPNLRPIAPPEAPREIRKNETSH